MKCMMRGLTPFLIFVLILQACAVRHLTPLTPDSLDGAKMPTLISTNEHYNMDYEKVAGALKKLGKDTDLIDYQVHLLSPPIPMHNIVFVLDHMDSEFLQGISLVYDPVSKEVLGACDRNADIVGIKGSLRLFNEMMDFENLEPLTRCKALDLALFYLTFSGLASDLSASEDKSRAEVKENGSHYFISVVTVLGGSNTRWQIKINKKGHVESARKA